MEKDKEEIVEEADEPDYPGSDAKTELELLMRAEALLKSVCKIALTENGAKQECQ